MSMSLKAFESKEVHILARSDTFDTSVRLRAAVTRRLAAVDFCKANGLLTVFHNWMRMATRSRSDEEGNALLGGPSLVGSAIAVPQSFVAATASILEEGYQSKLKEASDQEQRKSRKALARRWSEPYSDDGSVDLLDTTRFGLLVNYACIGFLNGLLPALVYPFFKLYLNMDGFQVSAAATVVRLPWSYKTLFGLLSDHLPIAGYRRKPYMLMGWIISIIALAVLAYNPIEAPYYKAGEIQRTRQIELRVVENADAANSGGRYLPRLLVVCAGYVMTDVACDGVMVEMAQLEPMEVRGQAQATIYMVRYSASLMAGFVAALSFNGQVYGGTFSWSVTPNNVFWGCAAVAVLGCCGTLLFFDETRAGSSDTSKSKAIPVAPLHEMWRILQQRAIWQLVAFHFWHSFLTSVNFSDLAAIQEFLVGVTPINNSLAGCVSTALVVFATFLMREYFLNTSWRWIMLICSLFTTVVFVGVNLITTFDIVRSQWFYLGGPQLAAIPEGMRSVVAGFVTVEIAEQGFEGATYALLTTVHNLAWPFAQSMTNLVDAYFDVSDAAIASDTPHVRWQVAYCLFIAGSVQLVGLVTLVLLPNQKKQAQELKRSGGSSRLAARVAIVGIMATLTWATTTNILAIHSSTACLIIAGGQGC